MVPKFLLSSDRLHASESGREPMEQTECRNVRSSGCHPRRNLVMISVLDWSSSVHWLDCRIRGGRIRRSISIGSGTTGRTAADAPPNLSDLRSQLSFIHVSSSNSDAAVAPSFARSAPVDQVKSLLTCGPQV